MISEYLIKIKAYIAIALLVIIIILLAALGLQRAKVLNLNKIIDRLEIDNMRYSQEIAFFEAQMRIINSFTNSSAHIEEITNENIFDEQKQAAINSIVADFYK